MADYEKKRRVAHATAFVLLISTFVALAMDSHALVSEKLAGYWLLGFAVVSMFIIGWLFVGKES